MRTMTARDRGRLQSPAFQGYPLLRVGFVIPPILAGIDTSFNWSVDWPK